MHKLTDIRQLTQPKKLRHFAGGTIHVGLEGHLKKLDRFLVAEGVEGAILSTGKITSQHFKQFDDPKGRYQLLINEHTNQAVMYFFKTDNNQYKGNID